MLLPEARRSPARTPATPPRSSTTARWCWAGGRTNYAATSSFNVVKGTDAVGPTGWTSLEADPNQQSTVLADSTNLSVIYKGGSQGLRKTTNGGANWFASDSGQTGLGYPRTTTVFDPTTRSRLFTGREQMFRTTNGGTSWQAASALFGDSGSFADRMLNVAVAPSDPNRVVATVIDGGSWGPFGP